MVPITSRTDHSVTVSVPSGNVVPPGPYMLFINQKTAKGDIPSVAKQVFVGAQAAPTPAAPPSAGLTAAQYNTLLTNNTPQQLGTLLDFLGGNPAGTGGAVPTKPSNPAKAQAPATPGTMSPLSGLTNMLKGW